MPPSWPAQAADVSTVLRSGLVAHGHDRPWPHEANKKSHREEIVLTLRFRLTQVRTLFAHRDSRDINPHCALHLRFPTRQTNAAFVAKAKESHRVATTWFCIEKFVIPTLSSGLALTHCSSTAFSGTPPLHSAKSRLSHPKNHLRLVSSAGMA
jgi:hypothetical protein